MAANTPTDVLIVGLGAMGAATASQAAKAGLRVVGIDRHRPPHHLGSTHAESRITRLAVGEGPQYLPTVRRSHQIWAELEQRAARPLFHRCGGLIITDPDDGDADPDPDVDADADEVRWGDFVTKTQEVADQAGIEFQQLDRAAALARHPALVGLGPNHRVGFEPTAGLVDCEAAVEVQLELAAQDGAQLRFDERVRRVEPDADGVDVVTDRGRYRADRVVLAAGPWMADLAPAVDAEVLTVTRQVVYWFEADDLDRFAIDRVPFVMWIGETIEDYLAVFPPLPGGTPAVKVLGEQFSTTTDAEAVERSVSAEEIAAFHATNVSPRVAGISDRCVAASVCLYTNTPDDHFLIDTAPASDRITVVSPCSGHGFKHSAALGEALAQRLATGTSTIDLSPFARR
ncbi:MAG: N-methyl-L-tryptophan oxidase [Actinomycetota bacterium]